MLLAWKEPHPPSTTAAGSGPPYSLSPFPGQALCGAAPSAGKHLPPLPVWQVLFPLYVTSSLRDFLWASHPTSIAFTDEYFSLLTCVFGPHGSLMSFAGSAPGTKQDLLIFREKELRDVTVMDMAAPLLPWTTWLIPTAQHIKLSSAAPPNSASTCCVTSPSLLEQGSAHPLTA